MRQPRAVIKVNGQVAQGVTNWEVTNNSLYQADKFRVELSLWGQAANMPWRWWAEQTQLTVQVFAGFPANPISYDSTQLTSLILGNADVIDIDPVEGTIVLEGRDYTALLTDTKIANKWLNQTSSQIATILAEAAKLTPQVTATTARVGTYYDIDHVSATTETSPWELLTYLAQKEGFAVYVTGSTLYFGPKPSITKPIIIQWQGPNPVPSSSVKRLSFSHNLTLARDVVVTVRSWNTLQKKAYIKTATAHHSQGTSSPPQHYVFSFPGLSPDQVQQKAEQLAISLSSHEMRMHAEFVPDVTTTVQNTLQLRGTPYDQIFYPEQIHRSMRMGEGEEGEFEMIVDAKNSSPESTVIA